MSFPDFGENWKIKIEMGQWKEEMRPEINNFKMHVKTFIKSIEKDCLKLIFECISYLLQENY